MYGKFLKTPADAGYVNMITICTAEETVLSCL